MNLAKELVRCGCKVERDDFDALLMDAHTNLFPSWTVDELLCHPTDALRFCREIRNRAKADIPEEVITHALLNARKNPD